MAIRNIRRDANDQIKKMEKDKTISEDEAKRAQDEVQKLTDKYIKEIDQIMAAKEGRSWRSDRWKAVHGGGIWSVSAGRRLRRF